MAAHSPTRPTEAHSAADTLAFNPADPDAPIRAVYHIAEAPDRVAAAARDIALEQTVEVPDALASAEPAAQRLVGTIVAIETLDAADQPSDSSHDDRHTTRFAVTIDYRAELAGGRLPQLLNLVYGNISIKEHIRLAELQLPDALLSRFDGPRFGVEGLRRLTGVYGRPLLATALKPRGSTDQQLAAMAGAFARGGGDIVKDDHNLVDDSLDAFRRRIDACQSAVERANRETGRQCLYAPNVCASADTIDAHVAAVAQRGIAGVLVSPLLIGLDTARVAARRHGLFMLAHPTFTGTFFHDRWHGIAPGVLLGTLFRMAGADASIFPNFGGRFTFTQDDCARIADGLRRPLGAMPAAFPAPAGGMKAHNLPDMAQQYGADALWLVGGALLGDDRPLDETTRAWVDAIRAHFHEQLTEPAPAHQGAAGACDAPAGACEMPGERATSQDDAPAHLPFRDDYTWQGRAVSEYKASEANATLPFKDVARHELIGRHGEQTAFDLRYFEIAPGGYTSCEKHRHTHTIIAVRGRGVMQLGEQRRDLKPLDVSYVPPMQTHQLRNESADTPFGFFCIVDHQRDRPQAP